MSAAILFTIVLAMGFGIASGYGIIVGILTAFNRNRSESKSAAALVPNTGTTGD
jgi:hypothetical protein